MSKPDINSLNVYRSFAKKDKSQAIRYANDFLKRLKAGDYWGWETLIFILFFSLLSSGGIQVQSKKQIKEAFSRPQPVKVVTFYCKNKKQYNKKVKRLLRIMDREKILNPIKVRYKKSKIIYFNFEFKTYFPK